MISVMLKVRSPSDICYPEGEVLVISVILKVRYPGDICYPEGEVS